MGFFLFSSQVLAWLPPLIFAAMNEAGVDQRIGIATLPIYLIIGIGCLCAMGSYRAALIASGREDMLPDNVKILDRKDEVEKDGKISPSDVDEIAASISKAGSS